MKKFLLAILVIMTTTFAQTTYAQLVGINNSNPDDALDVTGSGQISTYLKVGNPTAPASQTLNDIKLYDLIPDGGFGGVNYTNTCGSNTWGIMVNGAAKNYFVYTGVITTTPSLSRLLTSWMWIPTGSTGLYVDLEWAIITADNTWDGMYFEYTTDGTTFNKLTPSTGAYSTASFNGGANPATCAAPNTTGANWGVANTVGRSEFLPTGLAGKWVRFSVTATNDLANPVGEMRVYGLTVDCVAPGSLLNASFQNGSVYAEKNVYAGSNVMIGDVAEYFKMKDNAEPGMLVSLIANGKNQYEITKIKNDSKTIGVVSTSPTLTLNNPNAGTPIAMAGRVPICVTNENGVISAGDYLTASSTPGYAMKATGSCYVVGKAVESFSSESGKIVCVVGNGWMNTGTSEDIISGNFYIAKGKNTATIKNPAVTKNSKVSVTPLTGYSNYIVTKNDDGFKMTIEKIATTNMYFDYFAINTSGAKKATEDKALATQNAKQSKLIPIVQATVEALQVPAIPSDPTKFYKWDGKHVVEFNPSLPSKN